MGLGLDQFLNHNKDGGGRRKFLNWKKEGKATVWLSTRAAIAYPTWNHPFNSMGTWEDKDTGEEKEALRFNRFVSPDAEIVHQSQYFRDDSDRMKVPPLLDPFLLLREWLRFECQEPLDAVVFRWVNPKNGEVTEWRRGRLARLVDKSGSDWSHTLDTKLEYLFVVCQDDDPAEGCQIVRGTKLLGDQMKKAIGQEMESNGDKGNPLVEPYAFRWIFDKNARNPMESYRAFRYNKATLTDQIREAIMATDFPDPSVDTAPQAGDKAKIRAAMEDAAQIDLPWDLLFVDAWKDEAPEGGDGTDFNFGANAPAAETSAERTPEVKTALDRLVAKRAESSRAVFPAQLDRSNGTGKPRTRRKKKAEAPKPPPVERIPCDDCGHMMLPTETKCGGCGGGEDGGRRIGH
jgi:hypothetical protein